jgi:hypothetical protein
MAFAPLPKRFGDDQKPFKVRCPLVPRDLWWSIPRALGSTKIPHEIVGGPEMGHAPVGDPRVIPEGGAVLEGYQHTARGRFACRTSLRQHMTSLVDASALLMFGLGT